MKVIIAGSRIITDPATINEAVRLAHFDITCVFTGDATGVDSLGEQFAKINGIPVRHFPADWKREGHGAGHIRNVRMAEEAEALIAVWDGDSPGTRHMISTANKKGLKVFVSIPAQGVTARGAEPTPTFGIGE